MLEIDEIEYFFKGNKHLPWVTPAKKEKKGQVPHGISFNKPNPSFLRMADIIETSCFVSAGERPVRSRNRI